MGRRDDRRRQRREVATASLKAGREATNAVMKAGMDAVEAALNEGRAVATRAGPTAVMLSGVEGRTRSSEEGRKRSGRSGPLVAQSIPPPMPPTLAGSHLPTVTRVASRLRLRPSLSSPNALCPLLACSLLPSPCVHLITCLFPHHSKQLCSAVHSSSLPPCNLT